MPRYFFHIHDGQSPADREGTVFSSTADAMKQAIMTSGELLREHGPRLLDGARWSMEVVDEGGATICTLRFSAEIAPSESPTRRPTDTQVQTSHPI